MGTFFSLYHMILFLSPAKTLDFESDLQIGELTRPVFLDESQKINAKLKKTSRKKLMELQGISAQLASLNYARNQEWDVDHAEGIRQAALCFKGDVYQGLRADEWSDADMDFANDHVRILSGLYGILRPSDGIMPYRLEMGTSLKVGRRDDLYLFWHDKTKAYFKENIEPEQLVVNLASNEYFKAVEKAKVKNPILTVEFKDFSNGQFKVVSFFAKKARGLMADFIVRNRIEKVEDIKDFNSEGYYFDDKESNNDKYVFLRDKK